MTSDHREHLAVFPWTGPPPRAVVRVPGSKSLTNRALIIAAMADGPSFIGVLDRDDTRVMVEALFGGRLGIAVDHEARPRRRSGPGMRAHPLAGEASLEVAESGHGFRSLRRCSRPRRDVPPDGTATRQRPFYDLLRR